MFCSPSRKIPYHVPVYLTEGPSQIKLAISEDAGQEHPATSSHCDGANAVYAEYQYRRDKLPSTTMFRGVAVIIVILCMHAPASFAPGLTFSVYYRIQSCIDEETVWKQNDGDFCTIADAA